MGLVVNKEELAGIIDNLKADKKTIVSTNGCFDILHVGHVKYLQEAKSHGDILIIGLNSDASVKRLKGPERPINTEQDRAEVLAALECVDYVVMFEEDTPENLISMIKPDFHAKGGDYTEDTLPEAKIIKENGGQILFINFVDGKSTTNIINKAKITC